MITPLNPSSLLIVGDERSCYNTQQEPILADCGATTEPTPGHARYDEKGMRADIPIDNSVDVPHCRGQDGRPRQGNARIAQQKDF